jgi:hypothetical protein
MRDDRDFHPAEMVTKSALRPQLPPIRGDIEQVHLRLNTMEHSVSSRFEQVETELSRPPQRRICSRQGSSGYSPATGTQRFLISTIVLS